MEQLKEFIIHLISSTALSWLDDYVAVYETEGGFRYVVTFNEAYTLKSISYSNKTIFID